MCNTPLRAALFLPLAVGCGDKVVSLEDAHNYAYEGTIEIPAVTAAAASELDICWAAATKDIRCHDIDPLRDINNVSLIRFPGLTKADLEDKLARDALLASEQNGVVELQPKDDQTCAKLSDLTFFGTETDIISEFQQGDELFLLTLASSTTAGQGTRLMALLVPDNASTNTVADVGDGCGVVDFTADLSSLSRLALGAEGPFVVEWGALTRTGLGNELILGNIDGLMLAFYDGVSVAELEPQFLDLELVADRLYTMEIAVGSAGELTEATDADGAAFAGFSGSGTWLLALTCSTCANPAPLFMTVVDVQ